MFLGHYGLGFAAKKAVPEVSLGIIFIAFQFVDLLWAILLLFGIEKVELAQMSHPVPLVFTHYPISHSLVSTILLGIGFGGIYFLFTKNIKAAFLLFLGVSSHWILDFLVHLQDLPISINDPQKVGLGLWNFKWLVVAIEVLIFLAGAAIYEMNTTYFNNKGKYFLPLLILLFFITYTFSVIGPAPTNVNQVIWGAQFQWLFVLLAFAVDKFRQFRKLELM